MRENKLGDIISKLRKEKGLTQKELADEIHVSDKAVSRWETGKSSPNLETIYEISKFFQISFKDLLEARVNDKADDDLVEEIINEFTEINSKNSKRIKEVLVATLIIIVILVVTIIFSNTYNRFKVYKVGFESEEFMPVNGVYVETNIKDTLVLGNISLRDVEIKTSDTISLDIYYLENDKENILYTFSSLNSIHLDSYQSYIEIDNLSEYFDKLYLKLTIIDKNNDVKTYETKLTFVKDFSNSTLYLDNDNNEKFKESKNENFKINKSAKEIEEVLLDNGFEKISDDIIVKNNNKYSIKYIENFSKIVYSSETKDFIYKYTYYVDSNTIEILIYDSKNLEVENYKYDATNDKVFECITGSCNNYKEVLDTLEEKVLYLFE